MKKILVCLMILVGLSTSWLAQNYQPPMVRLEKTQLVIENKDYQTNGQVNENIDWDSLVGEEASIEELYQYQKEFTAKDRGFPMFRGDNFIAKYFWFKDYIVVKIIYIKENKDEN